MGFLKPKAPKSSSSNINNDLIKSTYAPQMQQGAGATNFLAQLLGVAPSAVSSGAQQVGQVANGIATAGGASPGWTTNLSDGSNGGGLQTVFGKLKKRMAGPSPDPSGGAAPTSYGSAQAGYQNYLQNAGYAPAMRQLAQGITGQGAAAGLLNSGTTARALQTRGTELNSQFFNNYLQQLAGLSGLGLQGGGLVANTGQVSKNSGGGPSTLGSIASTVGGIASIFSDRRLKHSIRKVGEFADGLGIYLFSYLGSKQRIRGVMADEVEKLRPWALGPKVAGYATVNYGAL